MFSICIITNHRDSWRFSLFFGGGELGTLTFRGGEHSVEDHYLHKKWNFTG